MAGSDNFVGCNAFVVSGNGKPDKKEIKTTVLSHNPDYMQIEVKGNFEAYRDETVSVVILHNSGVREFSGKIKKVRDVPPTTEIALFKGAIRESRAAKRYPVSVSATVDNLIVNSVAFPLLKPLKVMLTELSTVGLRIKARQKSFVVGTVFQMSFIFENEESVLRARVVWTKNISSDAADYGCELLIDENTA